MFSKAFPEMVALFQQFAKGKEKQKHRKKGLKFTPVHVIPDCFVQLVSYFVAYLNTVEAIVKFVTAD